MSSTTVFLGVKGGQDVRLRTSPPSVNRGNVEASKSHNPYGPLLSVTRVALPLLLLLEYCTQNCSKPQFINMKCIVIQTTLSLSGNIFRSSWRFRFESRREPRLPKLKFYVIFLSAAWWMPEWCPEIGHVFFHILSN
jgi:hypothetical protein